MKVTSFFKIVMLNFLAKKKVFRILSLYCVVLLVSVYSALATAQQHANHRQAQVVVYEQCDYRGKSTSIPIGAYSSLKFLKIANDKISSIKIPDGFVFTAYENDKFSGLSTQIEKNVRCLDSLWNNKISSLKVAYKKPFEAFDVATKSVQGPCFYYRAYTRGGDGRIKFHKKGSSKGFNEGAAAGQVCHQGMLTFEVNKLDLKTDVYVEIDGSVYRFAPNEKPDVFLNDWYRKEFKVRVR